LSSSPDDPKIELTVDPGSPTVAVSIIDSWYRTVAQSGGRLVTELDPGFYKVRYESGSDFVETLFELTSDQGAVALDRPPILSVVSAAPLARSKKLGPGHEERAVELSNASAIPLGMGSELFVFVRDMPLTPGDSSGSTQTPIHAASSLKLVDVSGKVIQDFGALASVDGCVGLNMALDPASYILRLEAPGQDALEQTIVTSLGWQTQVFLPLALLSTTGAARWPSLEDAAIFLAPIGQGFRADADEATWVEMARSWLARGEPVVPLDELKRTRDAANATRQYAPDEESLRDMLRAKFTNPMLGIYAAHLMMIAPNPDEELLREVAQNLKVLLGDHPDVIAIYLWLDPEEAPLPFLSPPMLRSSWSILVNRSRVNRNLIPPGSLTLRITGRLWGSGAWLVWSSPPPASEPTSSLPPAVDLNHLSKYLMNVLSAYSQTRPVESISQLVQQETEDKHLTDLESAVLSYTTNIVEGEMFAKALAEQLGRSGLLGPVRALYRKWAPYGLTLRAQELAEQALSTDNIVQALGVPQSAFLEAAAGLFEKFRLK
jgi:hypothetical protein